MDGLFRFRRSFLLLAGACLAMGAQAQAQDWPTKPVKFFVGSAPGSGPDVILRLVTDRLSKRLGQPVVIDNRPGAGGIPGTVAAARSPADGYNFFLGLGSALAMNQFLYKTLPYDPEKDFVPVVSLGVTPMVIAVNPESPAKSIGELLALAKTKPNAVSVGTTSKSAAHLTIASLAQQGNVQFLHAYYKGSPDALRDTMGGQVMVFSDALAAIPNLKDPRIRVLAITSPKRLAALPDVPVVAETVPGFASYGWYAVMAPTGVPQEIVNKLNRELNAVLAEPEVQARMRELVTFEPGGTPAQLGDFIRSERARLKAAALAAKIEPD
ncbi:MAG: tripartite tricarboxylate transporter substrate binding protein [Pseudomonadota bacterium]